MTTVLRTSPRRFVTTPAIERVTARALRYLLSGFSIHLRGPAGTGKTTLALHLADLLERPMMLMFGDDDAKTSDLIGTQAGYTRKKVVDNYIHSVVKVEDQLRQTWVDSRLTLACREGFTLIYDEFNRSRPEVNNVLLSVLEEKILVLPPESNRVEYVRVNPQFRAIFTSNPEEYCGVHSTQDALMDRLITITMPEPDELTQQEILVQKVEIDRASAALIVRLVKAFRAETKTSNSSGLRSCLMISTICRDHDIEISLHNPDFRDVCQDILLSRSPLEMEEATTLLWHLMQGAAPIPESQSILKELVPVQTVSVPQPATAIAPTLSPEPVDNTSIPEILIPQAIVSASNDFLGDEFVGDEPVGNESIDDESVGNASGDYASAVAEAGLGESVLSEDPIFASISETLPETSPETLPEPQVEAVADAIVMILEPEAQIEPEVEALEVETVQNASEFDEMPAAEEIASELTDVLAMLPDDWETEAEPEAPVQLSIEEQIYQYLTLCTSGARLSEIEGELGLQRSQTVDALRKLAQEKRLAHRDRSFFAIP
ncbi:gas vesicle protein GvpN [Alkalinema pantanalense CENA528]|uniref:gas vesicle protein GvpN n=1 Tax=Alkalinema pantanalense TaxID=1620705 RepID=UPI003D6FA7CA